MSLFQNKYRIESSRLLSWDYASAGAYFITICTKNKEHFFGQICDGEMKLNDIGLIAKNEWLQTLVLRPDMNLSLEDFVVMPNHFHAIIVVGENEFNNRRDGMLPVSTVDGYRKIQSKTLGSIIRGFKSSVTIAARKTILSFAWQDRFHDHVIRNQEEHLLIHNYIYNNPVNWDNDKFYTK